MAERIYMSQEEKIIEIKLERVEDKDYMVFLFDEPKSVCLNSEESQGELKICFAILLSEMLKNDNIKIKYIDNPDFTNNLYIDVVKEYVNDLNIEIKRIYSKIPEYISLESL